MFLLHIFKCHSILTSVALWSQSGILEIQILPTNGDSIICNGKEYAMDSESDVAPFFEVDVVKGQQISLVFKNTSSKFGKKVRAEK